LPLHIVNLAAGLLRFGGASRADFLATFWFRPLESAENERACFKTSRFSQSRAEMKVPTFNLIKAQPKFLKNLIAPETGVAIFRVRFR